MRTVLLGIGVACLLGMHSVKAVAGCAGDCDSDGAVTVNEVIQGVNIALDAAPISQCPSFDTDASSDVTINELIAAVNAALGSCPTGNFAGDYAATVSIDATYSGSVSLSANASGQISGSMLVTAATSLATRFQPALSFTFPAGGVSVALTGTYDPVSGGFEVEGSFVDNGGQTTPVVVSGDLPGPTGSAPINVYVGTDVFAATLSAATITTPTPTPSVTPSPANGARIVYSASELSTGDPADIFVINVDGSGKANIFHSVGYDTNPAWSPDGTKIAFSTPDDINDHLTIGIMNADGTGFHRIGEDEAGIDANPAWSPDGSQIVFTAGGGDAIDVMNADGSNRHRLVTKLAGDRYGHLSWSPDGSRIAFESTRGKPSNHADDFEIFVMNADGSAITPITNNSVEDRHPAWSLDGQTIAFGRGGGTASGVYSINPNGSGEKRLIFDPFVLGVPSPSWSQDGTQLAYPSLLGLKITNASGANAVTVPNSNGITDFDLK